MNVFLGMVDVNRFVKIYLVLFNALASPATKLILLLEIHALVSPVTTLFTTIIVDPLMLA